MTRHVRNISRSNNRSDLYLTEEEKRVENLYGEIWDFFTEDEYHGFADWMWYDYYKLGEPLGDVLKGATALDGGCGGGAASYAMLKEGAAKVHAIDLSGRALSHNENLVKRYLPDRADDLETTRASLLEIPFPDATFDFVHSAGVVMITDDPDKAMRELIRVLKPGGKLWIGMYGKGGLLGNIMIPAARAVNSFVPKVLTSGLMKLAHLSPLRRYEVLDAMYVPYRDEYTAEEVEMNLTRLGLTNLLRTDHALHPIYKYTPWLNGEGWLGYRADKPIEG